VLDAGVHATYRWSINGVNVGVARTLTARDSGTYAVTVTDATGCGATASARIDLAEPGSADIALGDVSAAPGDRLEIPLLLRSSSKLAESGATGYEARVRYRATMLVPSGTTPPGTVTDGYRVITVTGALPAGMTDGELARLEFMAALGDSESIAMQLEAVTWTAAPAPPPSVATVLHDGTFTLSGICRIGGARLVSTGAGAALKSVTPNPANGRVVVEYDILEDGPARLVVTDMLGREVTRLAGGAMIHGSYSATFDAATLSAGTYLVVLQTGTERLSMVMVRL
jgi:hypothetical protein